eukprot:9259490-Alexandrium_andersonii.AAC.1
MLRATPVLASFEPPCLQSASERLFPHRVNRNSTRGLAVAKDSGCGRVGGGPVRAPRRAYRKSLPIFEAATTEFFASKQFRLSGS